MALIRYDHRSNSIYGPWFNVKIGGDIHAFDSREAFLAWARSVAFASRLAAHPDDADHHDPSDPELGVEHDEVTVETIRYEGDVEDRVSYTGTLRSLQAAGLLADPRETECDEPDCGECEKRPLVMQGPFNVHMGGGSGPKPEPGKIDPMPLLHRFENYRGMSGGSARHAAAALIQIAHRDGGWAEDLPERLAVLRFYMERDTTHGGSK